MEFIVGKNTYMTVEEADEIVSDIYDEESEEYTLWNNSETDKKKRLILAGTRKLSSIVWLGIKYPGFQSMQWPRLIQYRYVDCPYDVKCAIIKQAIADTIYYSKNEASLVKSGVKSYQIKGASISFSDKANKSDRLDNGIWEEIYTEYLINWTA